ncbi:STN domain-containing protein [Caulobacter sp. BE254]|uniref:STN domain-containing protein n=1 Tax=Caulobacter sp. BE254 TaxID=2817720 RepID=UPI002864C571|nr:STN domain-containing protein [Caulobacter sp. BE254]MDR7115604.1 hypothetical protein [Caulobacter sp. BE254]
MADVAQASGAAPRLKGRYTPEQALQLLLAGSGLAYRRTADGAYIIYPAPPLAPSEPDNPVSLPELLVTARSRNSDIPRTLAVTYGDTPRFDAATKRVDGRIGFTPDGGRTDVMVAFSDFRGANLRVGERDYPAKARARRYANSRI